MEVSEAAPKKEMEEDGPSFPSIGGSPESTAIAVTDAVDLEQDKENVHQSCSDSEIMIPDVTTADADKDTSEPELRGTGSVANVHQSCSDSEIMIPDVTTADADKDTSEPELRGTDSVTNVQSSGDWENMIPDITTADADKDTSEPELTGTDSVTGHHEPEEGHGPRKRPRLSRD